MKTIYSAAAMAAAVLGQAENVFANAGMVTLGGRCGTWGDSLEQGAQTEARYNFTRECVAKKEARSRQLFAQMKCGTDEASVDFCPGIESDLGKYVTTAQDIEKAFHNGVIGTPGRKGYGTYGRFDVKANDIVNTKADGSGVWYAPPRSNDTCETIPAGFEVRFFCASGCYSPDQLLLTPTGYVDAKSALENNVRQMVSLSNESTLDKLVFKTSDVAGYITDIVSGRQELVVLETLSGGALKVTLNHPIVDGEGQMREAADFKVGQSLVKADGTRDPIISITRKIENTKVYNLDVANSDSAEKVIVAQGFLNGSVYFQNQGVKELNRRILRANAEDILQ